jgi:uncharacterized iron-regulated membrane protein
MVSVMFRKVIFWIHLCSGVTAGVVVFTMSLTGVILTYERQINNWVAEQHYLPAGSQGTRMALEDLAVIARIANPEFEPTTMVLTNHPGAPVALRAGRRGGVSLNPYTGQAMETESPGLSRFWNVVTGFHRWFNVQGENRALARQVTGVSNVVFLFLVLSGMYLWLPAIMKWTLFKARLLFRGSYPDSKARDFHWHHIFGIWAAVPLLAVVYTGAVISYPWAANLMYRAFGAAIAQPQSRNPAGDGNRTGWTASHTRTSADWSPQFLSLADLVDKALGHSGSGWNRLSITLPQSDDSEVHLEIDKGNGAQAHLRHSLALDRHSGQVLEVTGFSDTPKTQQLRGIARFLHTGEVLGFWGQTLAGLASLAALFLVWSGFALSWRRLVQPLLRQK